MNLSGIVPHKELPWVALADIPCVPQGSKDSWNPMWYKKMSIRITYNHDSKGLGGLGLGFRISGLAAPGASGILMYRHL